MATLNKVMLIGNLTRDPELRYIPSGSAVVTFTVAVNRVYKTQTGEKKEQTSFIRVVVWGRRAEVCGEYLTKGSPVFVEGRLQSRDWETQDGQKRNTVEVIADNIQFLRGGEKQASSSQSKKAPAANLPEDIETIDLNNESELSSAAGNGAAASAAGPSEEVPF
ncbi:MAG: single-stranded DNA-binding protein [Candidatus Omnitrophica bacterium]|nr:single-stranded DNA-binding protein [Candidatus Omnitrophota bacterium]